MDYPPPQLPDSRVPASPPPHLAAWNHSGPPLPGLVLIVGFVLLLPWELSVGKCWVGWAGRQAGAGCTRTMGGWAGPAHSTAWPTLPVKLRS